MEIVWVAVIAVVIGGLIYYANRPGKSLDVNKDGKVDVADAKAAVQNVVTNVKKTADVNKDGKVDKQDAKAAAKKVKTVVNQKKAAVRAKTSGRSNRKP